MTHVMESIMRKISLLLILLTMVSCDKITPPLEVREKTDVQLVNQIMAQVCRNLDKEKNLKASGNGSQMMHEIKMLALSFHYYQPVNEEKARELAVTAVDELVSTVNQNQEIRKYLYKYPFQPKNVEIQIFFNEPNGNNVSLVSCMKGNIDYQIEKSTFAPFQSIITESYDEAVEKLKSGNNNALIDQEAI
jgi:hypothetical protein